MDLTLMMIDGVETLARSRVSEKIAMYVLPVLFFGLAGGLYLYHRMSPIHEFLEVDATSEDHSRRPESLIPPKKRIWLRDLIKKGVLAEVGDGRLYVSPKGYRRKRIKDFLTYTILVTAGIAIGIWSWFFREGSAFA